MHHSNTSQENAFLLRDLWLSLLWIFIGNICETLFRKRHVIKTALGYQFKVSDSKTPFQFA